MAYKQLPIVREEYATTKYANQIKDNFDAIVGGQSVRETLTQLSNRLTTVSEQFGQYNEEIQRLITEFNSLRADINRALDNIDLRFEQLSADVIKKITTVSDNLKKLEDSTGYNTNLHQYFKNVNQARNLVLAINKLHEDVGDPRNLTTRIRENTVSAINELDMEVGNLSSLTTTEKGTIVGSINELDREVGPLNTLTTKNKNTIVQAISEVDQELGTIENLTTTNRSNVVNAINELDREIGPLNTLTTSQKSTVVGAINELDNEVGNLNSLTTSNKSNIVNSINEIDRDVGNVSIINDSEITASNLSEIIKKMKTLLGTFNSINSAIRRDNFVNSVNNLYSILLSKIEAITLKSGKNTVITSNKNIDVLGGVSKDYVANTKYYKNDFLWNNGVLYKATKEFTSSNFTSDLSSKNIEEIQTGGSDLNTSKVLNTYNERTVFNAGDLIFVTEESSDVQEQINRDIINKAVPIGCTYIQFAESNGTFSQGSSPSDIYPGTTWQLMYNTESVFFRTEGSLSEDGRVSGVQGDAIRNLSGGFYNRDQSGTSSGLFVNEVTTYGIVKKGPRSTRGAAFGSENGGSYDFTIDTSSSVPTAGENRVKNRLIRIYKRIS